jgi:hypothetical protein
MAAIRHLDEFGLAQTTLVFEKKRSNLGCAIDQDAGRASNIEFDNIAVLFDESCEHLDNLWGPRPLRKFAQTLAVTVRWWYRHQMRLLSCGAVCP